MLIHYANLFIYLTMFQGHALDTRGCRGSPHNPLPTPQGKLCLKCAAVKIHRFEASADETPCHRIWRTCPGGPAFTHTALTRIYEVIPARAGPQFLPDGGCREALRNETHGMKLWERPHLWRWNGEWKHRFVTRSHWMNLSREIKGKTWLSSIFFSI